MGNGVVQTDTERLYLQRKLPGNFTGTLTVFCSTTDRIPAGAGINVKKFLRVGGSKAGEGELHLIGNFAADFR